MKADQPELFSDGRKPLQPWQRSAFATPRPLARPSDPATSHAAARAIDNLTAHQAAVLRVLRVTGRPMTDDDIAEHYARWIASGNKELPEQTASSLRTRRSELVDKGLVKDSGQRAPMRTGRPGTAWSAT